MSTIDEDNPDSEEPVELCIHYADDAKDKTGIFTLLKPVNRHQTLLVLDLDETLLHSYFPWHCTPAQFEHLKRQAEIQERTIAIPEMRTLVYSDVGDGTHVVTRFRPAVRQFLMLLAMQYQLGVWSAGGPMYVQRMCELLWPKSSDGKTHGNTHTSLMMNQEGYSHLVFALDNRACQTEPASGPRAYLMYTKPLRLLKERYKIPLRQMLLLDNRRHNAYYEPLHHIHVEDYEPGAMQGELSIQELHLMGMYLCQTIVRRIEQTEARVKRFYQAMWPDLDAMAEEDTETEEDQDSAEDPCIDLTESAILDTANSTASGTTSSKPDDVELQVIDACESLRLKQLDAMRSLGLGHMVPHYDAFSGLSRKVIWPSISELVETTTKSIEKSDPSDQEAMPFEAIMDQLDRVLVQYEDDLVQEMEDVLDQRSDESSDEVPRTAPVDIPKPSASSHSVRLTMSTPAISSSYNNPILVRHLPVHTRHLSLPTALCEDEDMLDLVPMDWIG